MKYLLDTNICIYAEKKVGNVLDKLLSFSGNELAISSITLAELRSGIEGSQKREKCEEELKRLLNLVNIIDFDEKAAEEYGKIYAYLKKNGTPIGNMDMLIAAHARSAGLVIVTNNVREFERVPDLKVENWCE